ncbi:hypothetical protein FRC10_011753 [Ceratobasidium sp. 414]|nr:hypothetical protein FRC10_011753 [Ceratobasidium sp. 414]
MQATRTIPSAFVGTIPDIATDPNLFKAEANSFGSSTWHPSSSMVGYKNRTTEIIFRCLQFEITREEIDKLEETVNRFVTEYKRYYFQYEAHRLPACPLMIHAILHIPFYIRRSGPLWASWSFVMERFCGHLLPAVKNRVRPYEHMDNYVQRRAQMRVVSCIHNMPELAQAARRYRYEGGLEISMFETKYDKYPEIILGAPVTKTVEMTLQLMNQLTHFFGPIYPEYRPVQHLQACVDLDSLVRYGRFRLAWDGDNIRTASLIDNNPIARDNSWVKLYRQVEYGQLLDVYHVIFVKNDGTRVWYLLARVQACNIQGCNVLLPENPYVTFKMPQMRRTGLVIIHLKTVGSVVGRIQVATNEWAIVDRSRGNAPTQFTDDDSNPEHE